MDCLTGGGRRFATLCRDLFILAQDVDATPGPSRGWRWEARIANALSAKGFPVRSAHGGIEVFGLVPASGLRHQIDAAVTCSDALVIGEWKSYRGVVPKNEILRFKAVSDDLYDSVADQAPRRSVVRVFGVAGDASPVVRRYAARHGITLIERSRWPASVLADPQLVWPSGEGPSGDDLKRLAWLSRPMQVVYPTLSDGSRHLPRRLPEPAVEALLAMHDRWSDRLWDIVDGKPGTFEHIATALASD